MWVTNMLNCMCVFWTTGAARCRHRPERGAEVSWCRRREAGGQHFRTGMDEELSLFFLFVHPIKDPY